MLLNDHEAVVSLPEIRSLKYITIGTGIVVSEPWTMVKYGSDILATVYDSIWKVNVIDKRVTMTRKVHKESGSIFSRPFCIGLSVDKKTVYVVDYDKGFIGLSVDGYIVFQYQDQKVEFFDGLAVGRDCLFISVSQGNDDKVRRLTLSGDYLEDMDVGKSVPRKIIDNNLIITNYDKGEMDIRFFQLL